MHVRSVLGPDHRCTGSRFRRVLRAERDHVDRVLLVVHTSGADLLVEGLDGCRAGRIRTPATAEYTVVELILDRVLARGETAAVDYTLRYPGGGPWSHTRHVLYRPADVLVLETDFHPDGLPSRCTAFYSPRRTTPEQRLATLFLGTTIARTSPSRERGRDVRHAVGMRHRPARPGTAARLRTRRAAAGSGGRAG